MKDIIDLIARIFISLIFLVEAYDSIDYFKSTKVTMTEYGITWQQDILLLGAIWFLAIGAILVLIGYRSSLGATMLLLYWLPVTFIVHSFWNAPAELYRVESMAFMKNIAITGGLLTVFVNGSGKYSIKRLFATTKL
ncbi:MAG: DoxX family protein [Saprospiraceae bacterium]